MCQWLLFWLPAGSKTPKNKHAFVKWNCTGDVVCIPTVAEAGLTTRRECADLIPGSHRLGLTRLATPHPRPDWLGCLGYGCTGCSDFKTIVTRHPLHVPGWPSPIDVTCLSQLACCPRQSILRPLVTASAVAASGPDLCCCPALLPPAPRMLSMLRCSERSTYARAAGNRAYPSSEQCTRTHFHRISVNIWHGLTSPCPQSWPPGAPCLTLRP
mmetsp:Transcript_14611/g.36373  ORF Transcript_14611/g.36373 Transcript_14611/m.36373 type:complete len:213 (-) Transcript_14611:149-787(-)